MLFDIIGWLVVLVVQRFAEFNRLHLLKSKTFTNMSLRIILDNYFILIFGHMTADALKVNESQDRCM